MRPNTPTMIQPRRLLLNPAGRPVPSVLILSSTRAMAGLDMVAALAAAISDAPMLIFESLSCTEGFPSTEHLTLPIFATAGNAGTNIFLKSYEQKSKTRLQEMLTNCSSWRSDYQSSKVIIFFSTITIKPIETYRVVAFNNSSVVWWNLKVIIFFLYKLRLKAIPTKNWGHASLFAKHTLPKLVSKRFHIVLVQTNESWCYFDSHWRLEVWQKREPLTKNRWGWDPNHWLV